MGRYFDQDRARALIDLLAPARRTRIVEVGANPINENPYGNLLAMGACDVWGFEPEERAFARLKPGPHETYLPVAVGDGTRGTFHVCRSISLSSLLRPDARTTAFFQRLNGPTTVEREVPVDTVRLDDLDEIPPFDLLKIDVQGGELQVYDGARARLSTVAAVITEVAFVPLYEDQPLLDSQMARLRESGLDLHKFLFLKSFSLRGGLNTGLNKQGHANQLLDGDAVFLRSLRRPEAIGDETLKHMAILADTVFESFDIALRCVEHLVEREQADGAAAARYAAMLPDQAKSPAPAGV
ncbi:FkbM family methyltransferase [Oceaniglobus trochenteri]|uniref:FkbM family methyltransferase n=1 Tax=Oceaniglobus trochenteri TaxID=2763260 RepID=UPI001CFFEC37|nr:FkbM family methyltransferase [Oceaniglobus trochenteri]